LHINNQLKPVEKKEQEQQCAFAATAPLNFCFIANLEKSLVWMLLVLNLRLCNISPKCFIKNGSS